MNQSVLDWAATVLTEAGVAGRDVLEAGAMNVNGSVRPLVELLHPATYLATDMQFGPGVDRVMRAEDLPPGSADIVISTEMLEHCADWQAAMLGLIRALRLGGLLVLTTRSPGFPLHEHPGDHWRFTVSQMRAILARAGLSDVRVTDDPLAPGVFAIARKTREPDAPDWAHCATPVEAQSYWAT